MRKKGLAHELVSKHLKSALTIAVCKMSRLFESGWGLNVIYLYIYLLVPRSPGDMKNVKSIFSIFDFLSVVASPTSFYRLSPHSPRLQLGMARLQHLLRGWKTFHLPYKLDVYHIEYIFHCGNNAVLYCLLHRLEKANGGEHRETWG